MKKDFRFHPSYIVVEIIKGLKNLFFPIFLAFILQSQNDAILWVMARYILIGIFICSIIYYFLVWRTTTYRFEDERFILKKGIFSKTRTTIDYNRIQNVQRNTSAIHNLLGVTSLHFTTASSAASSNIELEAISKQIANDLEKLVNELRNNTKQMDLHKNEKNEMNVESTHEELPVKQEPIIHFQPTTKQTIKAAFTSLSFLIIFPIIAVIIDNVSDFIQLEERFNQWVSIIKASYILIGIIIASILLLGIIAGLITTYLKYGRFTISSDEDYIYIHRGILSEHSFTIRKRNVQGLQIRQNMMKRLLRLREIKLIHIGQGVDEEDSIDSLYPFLEEKDADSLIQQLLPKFDIRAKLLRLPKAALYLHVFSIPYLFIIVLIAIFIWNFSYWWAVGALVYTIVSRLFIYFFTRYALDGESIIYKTGAWSTDTFITNRNNLIELSFNQGPIQRLLHVCTIQVTTRAQPIHVVHLEHVPISFADEVLQWYEKREVTIDQTTISN